MKKEFLNKQQIENLLPHREPMLLIDEFHDIENPVKYLTFKITDISDIEENNELLING